MQKSNSGDDRISDIGSLEEVEGKTRLLRESLLSDESVGQEGAGSQMRFEDQAPKKSFICDTQSRDGVPNRNVNLSQLGKGFTPVKSMAQY